MKLLASERDVRLLWFASALLITALGSKSTGSAPLAVLETPPAVLSREEAMVWGLRHNPDLAALRQQHGIAAAAIVIANTYPLNPSWESRIQWATGPVSAGITTRVPNEQLIFFPVEVRGQGRFRRQGASASLSR